jgi:hypothetical protein
LGRHAFRLSLVEPMRLVEPVTGDKPKSSQRMRVRRPAGPSRRASGVDMGRATFLKIVACWGIGLLALLALALVIRLIAH